MSWKRGYYIGTPPTTRFGHTATAIGPHLLIFGGWEYTKAQNEIIVLRECTNKIDEEGGAENEEEGEEVEEGEEGMQEEDGNEEF